MKFLKSRAGMLSIMAMSILCLIAAIIAVKVSVNLIERRGQELTEEPRRTVEAEQVNGRDVNTSKMAEQAFYFNGSVIMGVSAYTDDDINTLVAFDSLLDRIGAKYKYYSSDDLLETEINGRKLLMKLGNPVITYGEKEISLPVPPIAARDHILVSAELFKHMEGFYCGISVEKGSVFVNYYPEYKELETLPVKILRNIDGVIYITGLTGGNAVLGREFALPGNEWVEVSGNGNVHMLKSGERVYLMDKSGSGGFRQVSVPAQASLSYDGKYLYWTDREKQTSYVYNTATGEVTELGDYFARANAADKAMKDMWKVRLFDYNEWKGFRKVVLQGNNPHSCYAFIEKAGNPEIEGRVMYSPDMGSILYKVNSKGWFAAGSDGNSPVSLGDGDSARWVDNNRIYMQSGNQGFIMDGCGNNRSETYEDWNMIGRSAEGGTFYSDGTKLYCETGGVEEAICALPSGMSYISGLTSRGPFAAVSKYGDSVMCSNGGEFLRVGSSSLFIREPGAEKDYVNYSRNVVCSPTYANIAVFQRENGFYSLSITNTATMEISRVVLDCRASDIPGMDDIEARWLDDYRLFVHTGSQGWVINVKDKPSVFEWKEREGSTMEEVVP